MMLYARSCERPSKRSSSVFLPSWVSNSYSFSTGTHGSSRRFSLALRPSSACSASSFASSSRAACHSSRVPTLCSGIPLPPFSGSQQCRPERAAKLIARASPPKGCSRRGRGVHKTVLLSRESSSEVVGLRLAQRLGIRPCRGTALVPDASSGASRPSLGGDPGDGGDTGGHIAAVCPPVQIG